MGGLTTASPWAQSGQSTKLPETLSFHGKLVKSKSLKRLPVQGLFSSEVPSSLAKSAPERQVSFPQPSSRQAEPTSPRKSLSARQWKRKGRQKASSTQDPEQAFQLSIREAKALAKLALEGMVLALADLRKHCPVEYHEDFDSEAITLLSAKDQRMYVYQCLFERWEEPFDDRVMDNFYAMITQMYDLAPEQKVIWLIKLRAQVGAEAQGLREALDFRVLRHLAPQQQVSYLRQVVLEQKALNLPVSAEHGKFLCQHLLKRGKERGFFCAPYLAALRSVVPEGMWKDFDALVFAKGAVQLSIAYASELWPCRRMEQAIDADDFSGPIEVLDMLIDTYHPIEIGRAAVGYGNLLAKQQVNGSNSKSHPADDSFVAFVLDRILP